MAHHRRPAWPLGGRFAELRAEILQVRICNAALALGRELLLLLARSPALPLLPSHLPLYLSLSLSLSLSLCARVDFVLLRNLDECSIIKLIALSFTGMCLLMLSLLVCRSVSVEIFMI
jgi:hypothetical protein